MDGVREQSLIASQHFAIIEKHIMLQPVDQTDIPFVGAADLRVTYKMFLARVGAAAPQSDAAEQALRDTEQLYWQAATSDVCHKSAVLIRLRALLNVCQSRHLRTLVTDDPSALDVVITSAASERLNASRGFNPLKLAWAVTGVLVETELCRAA